MKIEMHHQNLWNVVKAVLRGKCIALNANTVIPSYLCIQLLTVNSSQNILNGKFPEINKS